MGAENDVKDSSITKLTKLNAFIQEMFRFKAPLFGPFIRKAKTTHFIKDLKIEKGNKNIYLQVAMFLFYLLLQVGQVNTTKIQKYLIIKDGWKKK